VFPGGRARSHTSALCTREVTVCTRGGRCRREVSDSCIRGNYGSSGTDSAEEERARRMYREVTVMTSYRDGGLVELFVVPAEFLWYLTARSSSPVRCEGQLYLCLARRLAGYLLKLSCA
jgi:hypothetical protein